MKPQDLTTENTEKRRNHRGHREILIYKKLYKVFESAQSISLWPLWLSLDNTKK